MPRWKQTFTCAACGHTAWREVVTDAFDPEPDPERLAKRGHCTKCGATGCQVTQEKKLPKYLDAFQPGGMRLGLMTFAESTRIPRQLN